MQILFSYRTLSVLIALALASMLYFSTRWGLGMSADSVGYLKGAIGALNGRGLTQFSTNWPPLYPIVLTLFGWVAGNDVLLGARFLHSLLFAANFLLIVLTLQRMSVPNYASILFGGLIAIHSVSVYVQFYAWSESSFITLILINLLLLNSLSNELETGKKTLRLELFIAVLTGMAILLRYAAVALVLSNVCALMLMTRSELWFTRFKRIAIQVALPVLMLMPWLFFNLMRAETATQRTLAVHFPGVELFKQGLSTIGFWYVPRLFDHSNLLAIFIGIILIGLIFTGLILKIQKRDNLNINNLVLFCAVFTATYFAFLLFSISFIDIATPLDDRILSPAFICMTLMLFGLSANIRSRVLRILVFIGLVVCLGSSAIKLKSSLLINYFNGVELASDNIRNRPINKFIQRCSPNLILASDTPWDFDLYLLTKAIWLPRTQDMTSGLMNKNYNEEIQSLENKIDLIAVTDISSKYPIQIDRLKSFNKIYSNDDGIIWINQKTVTDSCTLIRSFQ